MAPWSSPAAAPRMPEIGAEAIRLAAVYRGLELDDSDPV
jgi:hypothetical protein